jgi:hypothetical protein
MCTAYEREVHASDHESRGMRHEMNCIEVLEITILMLG